MLHTLTERQVSDQMDHYVGPDWEQRVDNLVAAREAQLEVTTEPAHGAFAQDDIAFDFWCGARRIDEGASAAGYYRTVVRDDGQDEVQFRPLVSRLRHDEAELLAKLLHSEIGGDFVQMRQLADGINEMKHEERESFFADVRRLDFSPSARERTLDLDIEL